MFCVKLVGKHGVRPLTFSEYIFLLKYGFCQTVVLGYSISLRIVFHSFFGVSVICNDDIARKHNLYHINILHFRTFKLNCPHHLTVLTDPLS
jgi:hypothetical protein